MSVAESIASQIPYLRRYARVLAGSQQCGDAYVAATLEAVVADGATIGSSGNARTGLYRVLSGIWNSLDVNLDELAETPSAPDRRLQIITPRPRQAFLLTAVEGFSIEEAATVLATDTGEIEDLISQAGAEIARQVATDVLIIEDEPIIALDLEMLVDKLGHRVLGVARTHGEAIELVRDRKPGLVLADIQLADGTSGISAVNEMLKLFEVPVVFITAYPERLLTGNRPEPAFLITKPFDEMTVRAVASQALFFENNAHAPN